MQLQKMGSEEDWISVNFRSDELNQVRGLTGPYRAED